MSSPMSLHFKAYRAPVHGEAWRRACWATGGRGDRRPGMQESVQAERRMRGRAGMRGCREAGHPACRGAGSPGCWRAWRQARRCGGMRACRGDGRRECRYAGWRARKLPRVPACRCAMGFGDDDRIGTAEECVSCSVAMTLPFSQVTSAESRRSRREMRSSPRLVSPGCPRTGLPAPRHAGMRVRRMPRRLSRRARSG